MESVESQIAEWRAYVANAPGVNGHDVDELEDHLRHQIAELNAAGLTADEGFLIAVKRLGDVDGLSREFARQRRLDTPRWVLAAAPFVLAALVVNLYPYDADSATEALVALHLPVVLWFAVAYPYMGGTVRPHERRMDFVRFTGEWFIYYVLIALGGGVLMGLTALILRPAGLMDRVQLLAIASALVLDVMVLGAMLARIGDLGVTPNRAAALGLNLVL